jgi:hypothetical protein
VKKLLGGGDVSQGWLFGVVCVGWGRYGGYAVNFGEEGARFEERLCSSLLTIGDVVQRRYAQGWV